MKKIIKGIGILSVVGVVIISMLISLFAVVVPNASASPDKTAKWIQWKNEMSPLYSQSIHLMNNVKNDYNNNNVKGITDSQNLEALTYQITKVKSPDYILNGMFVILMKESRDFGKSVLYSYAGAGSFSTVSFLWNLIIKDDKFTAIRIKYDNSRW